MLSHKKTSFKYVKPENITYGASLLMKKTLSERLISMWINFRGFIGFSINPHKFVSTKFPQFVKMNLCKFIVEVSF